MTVKQSQGKSLTSIRPCVSESWRETLANLGFIVHILLAIYDVHFETFWV
jgi:hypothetical protein